MGVFKQSDQFPRDAGIPILGDSQNPTEHCMRQPVLGGRGLSRGLD